jgi:hypothetical protein
VVLRWSQATKSRRGDAKREQVCDSQAERRTPDDRQQRGVDDAHHVSVGEALLGKASQLGDLDD